MNWLKGILILILGVEVGILGMYFADTKYDYWGLMRRNKNIIEAKSSSANVSGNYVSISEKNQGELQYRASYNGKVPILMYHHIKVNTQPNNAVERGLDVSPEMFEKQIEILSRLGYQAITMKQLQSDLEAGNVNTRRVVLTFDDGYDDIYTNAWPILKKYNMVGTIYLITDGIGNKNYMTANQINELKNEGFEIGSHTLSHPNLATASQGNLIREIVNSKKYLEDHFNVEVSSLCYPSGKFNEEVMEEVKLAGYGNAVTTIDGYVDDNSDLFALNRVRISGTGKLSDFVEKIFVD